ncbi:NAD-dependent epimerase/dehydratase family protein [Actinocrispum wychmicini]|uniref:Nucleoside-diphosphate-sugar epimerase n=1 Tax=Actinocrispum wychmicini TaxID=1213861 RepID=A0A4R2IY52_9PSEU|nr:NAD-dependent epimerase/dehydratase family protein [Actinocrispum wychmicini]TCO48809.1 nucleoside-diphosphate-sugar epimerase [Actinocrispum wychmicini]
MSHVLLAGASGVVGRRVVPLLVAHGHQVTALSRRPQDLPVDVVIGDVFDREALIETVRRVSPDVVMHQLTDLSGRDFAANAEIRRTGTRNLVDAALAAGAGKVIAQSIAWVYEPGDKPATEQTPLDNAPERAGTVGAVAALEEAVREAPEWVVLRYGLFYGPTTWYARDGLMGEQARAGELVADGDVSSFVHVDDAASAAVAALDWPSGVVNVVDDEPAAGHDWLPVFCTAVGAPPPSTSDTRHGWARGADNSHARGLGWVPRHPSWRTGFDAW